MRRRGVLASACCAVLLAVTACGGPADEPDGTPVLHWYVGPDRFDVEELADTCTEVANGAYEIQVEQLPADVDERRTELVRRLTAQDDGIDLFSMDLPLAAELASAQVLAPVPEALKEPFAADVAPAALDAATVDGLLVAAPWWYDPYLLWWRGAAAERAGLDTEPPVTWAQLVEGAQRTGRPIGIDDTDGDALGAWVAALVAGAGGSLLEGEGRDPDLGLDTTAGRRAAEVVEAYSGPGLDPSDDAVETFARRGGFLLAPSALVADPAVAPVAGELRWTSYPVVDDAAAPPAVGVALAVPLYAPRTDLSYEAIECLTTPESMAELMTGSGHSSARLSTYEEPDVVAGYPLADVTLPSVEASVTVPRTPYWSRVRAGLDATWRPVGAVDARTPARSARTVADLLRGGLG